MITLSKRVKTVLLILVVTALVLTVAISTARQDIHWNFDATGVARLVRIHSDDGQQELSYAEHSAIIDALVEQLNGTYHYVGRWNHRDASRIGAQNLIFYDAKGNELGGVFLKSGYLVRFSSLGRGSYCLYQHENGLLDLSKLEAALESTESLVDRR